MFMVIAQAQTQEPIPGMAARTLHNGKQMVRQPSNQGQACPCLCSRAPCPRLLIGSLHLALSGLTSACHTLCPVE